MPPRITNGGIARHLDGNTSCRLRMCRGLREEWSSNIPNTNNALRAVYSKTIRPHAPCTRYVDKTGNAAVGKTCRTRPRKFFGVAQAGGMGWIRNRLVCKSSKIESWPLIAANFFFHHKTKWGAAVIVVNATTRIQILCQLFFRC